MSESPRPSPSNSPQPASVTRQRPTNPTRHTHPSASPSATQPDRVSVADGRTPGMTDRSPRRKKPDARRPQPRRPNERAPARPATSRDRSIDTPGDDQAPISREPCHDDNPAHGADSLPLHMRSRRVESASDYPRDSSNFVESGSRNSGSCTSEGHPAISSQCVLQTAMCMVVHMTSTTLLEQPIEGLWATPGSPLPFDPRVSLRAFLLEREDGNVIVYNAPGLRTAATEIRDPRRCEQAAHQPRA